MDYYNNFSHNLFLTTYFVY